MNPSSSRQTRKRFLIFVGVGVVSSLFYLAVLSLCVDLLGWGVLVGACLAFLVGTTVSYFGNTILTFSAETNSRTLRRFLVVTLFGMAVNQAIAWSLDQLGIHYFFIAVAVFVFVPIINFIGHSAFTYRGQST